MPRTADISEFAESQARGRAPALRTYSDAVSAVGSARAAGGRSAGRAGQYAEASGPPRPTFVTINDIDYLLDLEPQATGKRMLALETDDDQSQGMSVVVGYQTRDAAEHATPAQIADVESQGPYDRSHVLLIQFGTANAPSVVEVDVVEGMSVNIPGAKCEVTVLDYAFDRLEDPTENNPTIRSHASAANGAVSTRAQMTQLVFCPYQVDVDLAQPPSFSELKQRLISALSLSTLDAVGLP